MKPNRILAKIDRRQLAAYAVILFFMAVTVGHVANYAASFESDGWRALGLFYALAIDASIIVCAWLTRWKTTGRWAWIGYLLSVLASGLMNVAQVRPWSREWFAWVYAVFPTVAQSLLGFLARDAGQFTKSRSSNDEVVQLRAKVRELEKGRTMKEPTRADYLELCAGLNGNMPTNARSVNKLLQDHGYYARPDATARSWCSTEARK